MGAFDTGVVVLDCMMENLRGIGTDDCASYVGTVDPEGYDSSDGGWDAATKRRNPRGT